MCFTDDSRKRERLIDQKDDETTIHVSGESWRERRDTITRNSWGILEGGSRGIRADIRFCKGYLVFTCWLDPADRIWRMDNLMRRLRTSLDASILRRKLANLDRFPHLFGRKKRMLHESFEPNVVENKNVQNVQKSCCWRKISMVRRIFQFYFLRIMVNENLQSDRKLKL